MADTSLRHQFTYRHVAAQFHQYHRHTLNIAVHAFTTALAVWAIIHLALIHSLWPFLTLYVLLTLTTLPLYLAPSCTLVLAFLTLHPHLHPTAILSSLHLLCTPTLFCLILLCAAIFLQEASHYVFKEPTYMQAYLASHPLLIIPHTLWLLGLVLDALQLRRYFLPRLVPRHRALNTQVAATEAIHAVRHWTCANIIPTSDTTHLYPRLYPTLLPPIRDLENDANILQAFRQIFPPNEFDISPIPGMNELYVAAVGDNTHINSDAVFYTPHTDGPFCVLPGASVYRVLVAVTPNVQIRTHFCLLHPAPSETLDIGSALGFDYNRELHYIDNVPGMRNAERRTVLKLHYAVFPHGWTKYGRFVAIVNESYNSAARKGFLKTLRPHSWQARMAAWSIWLTTVANATFITHVGWGNFALLTATRALGHRLFLVVSSFWHYELYFSALAFVHKSIAHGVLVRDARLFKAFAIWHLFMRVAPLVDPRKPSDVFIVVTITASLAVSAAVFARLGVIRTYFGAELGLVESKWISGFPYNILPHPMIVGQVVALVITVAHWGNVMNVETWWLIMAHIACQVVHLTQEKLTSRF